MMGTMSLEVSFGKSMQETKRTIKFTVVCLVLGYNTILGRMAWPYTPYKLWDDATSA